MSGPPPAALWTNSKWHWVVIGWCEPNSRRVLCQWLTPVLTCLSKAWSPGEVYFPGTHRSTETGHHRCWQSSVWPRHPSDAAAGTARGKPGRCPPRESMAEEVGESQGAIGSRRPRGHRIHRALDDLGVGCCVPVRRAVCCPPQHSKHEPLRWRCFARVLKVRAATMILSQFPGWCRVWSPCVSP